MRKLSVLLALLLLAPAVSQAKTLEDLLVEKGVMNRGEAAAVSASGASKVYWDAGTRTEFADTGFTAGWATYIQTGYAFYDRDEDYGLKNASSFEVRKARLILSGTALHKEFSYFVQADLVGNRSSTGSSSPELLDAYLTWNACDWASVTVGQFKTAISRQFNTPDEKLQFASRGVISDIFTVGRNQGARVDWKLAGDDAVLSAGLFNGLSTNEGMNSTGQDNLMLGEVALRGNIMGKMDAFEEGDIGNTQDTALNAGVAFGYGQKDGVQRDDTTHVNVDITLKTGGFSLAGEYFYANVNPDGGSNWKPQGLYLQGGYFFEPKTWEVAARYGWADCDNGDGQANVSTDLDYTGIACYGNDNVQQATIGVNYFWWKNFLKAQAAWDYVIQDPAAGGSKEKTNVWSLFFTGYF